MKLKSEMVLSSYYYYEKEVLYQREIGGIMLNLSLKNIPNLMFWGLGTGFTLSLSASIEDLLKSFRVLLLLIYILYILTHFVYIIYTYIWRKDTNIYVYVKTCIYILYNTYPLKFRLNKLCHSGQ